MINSGWCVGSGCTTTRRRGGMIDVGGCSWGPHPRRLVVLPGLEPWCPPSTYRIVRAGILLDCSRSP